MEKIVVEQSPGLKGEISVSGAKNSVLKILAASLLAEGPCVIEDVPDLLDVRAMIDLLRALGSKVDYYPEENKIITEVVDPSITVAPYELTNRMRASIVVLGPLLARRKRANVSLPGGCPIGARPIDLHIKGFRTMGYTVTTDHGYVEGYVDGVISGGQVYLDFPSVGATENIMMAAVMANGTTTIFNAAQEPEITDLANFLTKMGASISGAGTSIIRIKGVRQLIGVHHQVIPDRIEAGTYMVAAALTKGQVLIKNVLSTHLRPVISKLEETGVIIEERGDALFVDASAGFSGVDITTLPYPGFPTDMQAQFMVMLCVAEGIHSIKETVFENRFLYVNELMRMGAKIKVDGSSAMISGVDHLEGAQVRSTDLRAGAALILAGLVATGTTEVFEPQHIDRGFVAIEDKLRGVGANIRRVKE
ncbi:MAG TPA: UDP-N-acetylglucosamine 1-carboxyvinyltransferase [Tissierellia bacterium]|nr:UDP-N-acetylglucosamine 1-carboxyvinyltransferase [Tissierellia bacterium]